MVSAPCDRDKQGSRSPPMNSQGGDEPCKIDSHRINRAGNIDGTALAILLAAGWTFALASGVTPAILLTGVAAWIAGIGLKIAVAVPLAHIAAIERCKIAHAGASGILSAVAEMGAAVGFAWYFLPTAGTREIVAFAFAAATVETMVLMAEGFWSTSDSRHLASWSKNANYDFFVRHALFVERSVAILLHVGTRTLAVVGFVSGAYGWVALATLTFGALDGVADFGEEEEWQWYDRRVFYWYFGAIAAAGLSSLVLALYVA